MTYWTIDAIERANKAAGYHFFDRDAKRFFRSRISPTVYQGAGGVFFVTSEQYESSLGERHRRCYTVRRFNPAEATVNSASEFNKMSRGEAVRLAKRLAGGEVTP